MPLKRKCLINNIFPQLLIYCFPSNVFLEKDSTSRDNKNAFVLNWYFLKRPSLISFERPPTGTYSYLVNIKSGVIVSMELPDNTYDIWCNINVANVQVDESFLFERPAQDLYRVAFLPLCGRGSVFEVYRPHEKRLTICHTS